MLAEANRHTCCILYACMRVFVDDIAFILHQSILVVVIQCNAINRKLGMRDVGKDRHGDKQGGKDDVDKRNWICVKDSGSVFAKHQRRGGYETLKKKKF